MGSRRGTSRECISFFETEQAKNTARVTLFPARPEREAIRRGGVRILSDLFRERNGSSLRNERGKGRGSARSARFQGEGGQKVTTPLRQKGEGVEKPCSSGIENGKRQHPGSGHHRQRTGRMIPGRSIGRVSRMRRLVASAPPLSGIAVCDLRELPASVVQGVVSIHGESGPPERDEQQKSEYGTQ